MFISQVQSEETKIPVVISYSNGQTNIYYISKKDSKSPANVEKAIAELSNHKLEYYTIDKVIFIREFSKEKKSF